MSDRFMMVIAPAKKLADTPQPPPMATTQPRYLKHSMELATLLRQCSAADLKKLMHINDELAALNVERYQHFSQTRQEGAHATAALATFKGDVFQRIDADNLSEKQWNYAQHSLRVISGLYGLLRPLDRIQPYRLDMGTALKNPHGKNLYAFWSNLIAETLREDMVSYHAKILVNLASKEYFQTISNHWPNNIPVVSIHFKEEVNGALKVFGMNAKRARGLMVHDVLTQPITELAALKNFNAEGYVFSETLSTDSDWVFTREKQ